MAALAGGAAAAVAAESQPMPDFSQHGWQFLEKHCVGCHGGKEPKAELSLEAFRDSVAVVKDRKTFDKVVKMLFAGEMPPDDRPQPTVAEVDAFTANVRAVFDFADRHAKPDPGRVTMRRLNRVEYKNTIRDLLGVDFDPTGDFPSDDIGHGFDNIGDVLTLPPVLMERYLAAAEAAMSQAIQPNPPPVPKRHLSTRYTEPASANVPMEGNFRVLASDGDSPVKTGPINTPYKWDADGEYIFRTRVFAKKSGDQPVKVAVLIHGERLKEPATDDVAATLAGSVLRPVQILKTFEIEADSPDNAETLEVPVPPMADRQRMAVAIIKPAEGQPVKLHVEYLALEGPLDTRPASQRMLLACSPDKPKAEQTREVLTRFASRAYRRPATADEVNRLVSLVEQAEAGGQSWEASLQLAMQAVLCSPKFLFRVELDDRPEAPESRPLDEFQLASRLSYFLWSTMPDAELFDLARRGELNQRLDAQVDRMLSDPKSQALIDNFAVQWLQIQRLATFVPDAKTFPQFNDRLRAAMLEETRLFFGSVVREDRSILELLDADYTFLNEPLARLYGIADTNGNLIGKAKTKPGGELFDRSDFKRVSLQDRSRGGLVTQASMLTVTSNPTRTSPVKRGRWVLEQLLGAPPPPPPPDVPLLPEDAQAIASGSLRQRLEVHRRNPACANCHAKMDPLGFALENYDGIGAYRTEDAGFPINACGELPDGTKFEGPEDLKSILLEQREAFTRCLTEKLLIYGLGRGLEYYDRPVVEKIVAAVGAGEYKFSTLVTEIAKSEPFQKRRGSDAAK